MRPVNQLRFITIVIVALAVISAITAVGIVLVIGLLCPCFCSCGAQHKPVQPEAEVAGTGLLLCGGGMMLAILWDLPPGPLIGVLCMALLMLQALISRRR